jgi:hypothetical protein
VFEKRTLGRIFAPGRKDFERRRKGTNNEEFNNFYSPTNITRMIGWRIDGQGMQHAWM